jgi:hypothetical protein
MSIASRAQDISGMPLEVASIISPDFSGVAVTKDVECF